jgi:Holliday junction DNA helicase RuvA
MICHLKGTVSKHSPGELTIDVSGVGYHVHTPLDVWDGLTEGQEAKLNISTVVREDTFALYGFSDRAGRTLFESFIAMSGIGPKLGLELCGVPRAFLLQAIGTQDPKILTAVKGVGKKTAEKLLLDLKSLIEKEPGLFGDTAVESKHMDQDAIDALRQLGYDTGTIMNVLKDLPEDLETTEKRVTEALRSL